MNVPNQNLTEFDNVRISVVLSCSLYNHLQVTGLLLGCSNLRPPCGWCQIMLVESGSSVSVTVSSCGPKQQLIISAANCSSPPSTDQHATDKTAVSPRIRCDCVGGDECDRIRMWNINYDERRPHVIRLRGDTCGRVPAAW